MRVHAGLFAAISMLVSLAAFPARADLYTVRGIEVDETAASATQARSVAQVKGQRLALTELMRRLTLSEDWGSLPQVSDQTAQDAVRGFQVASEKTSSTRYIAVLNVSFNPERVKRLLRGQGISYAEAMAKPVTLVPAYLGASGADGKNPWRAAWESLDLGNAITPVTLSAGDVATGEAIVSKAVLGAGGKLDISTSASGGANLEPITQSHQGGNTPEGMKAAAAATLAAIGQQWKKATIVRGGAQAQLTSAVFFSSVEQWESIRRSLSSTPLVQGVQINGVSAGSAEVQIDYRGTPDKLAFLLEQKNVALAQGGTGWTLRAK